MKKVLPLITTLLISALCLSITSCGLFQDDHNKKCDSLAEKKKAEKEYAKNHIPAIDGINIYVENSGSMDGYVNGNTEFKTDIFNVIKSLSSESGKDVKKNYINDSIIPVRLTDSQFTNGMSTALFQQLGGNRTTSNIAELIEKIIAGNKKSDIDIFVSDCVFDPENDPDIDKRLGQQKTIINTAIKKKLKSDSEFGVLVYMMMSSFTGTYYNKMSPHTHLNNVQRPYYIWIFGDAYRLKKVREVLAGNIESRAGTQTLVATNTLGALPYRCPSAKCSKNGGKHIDRIDNNKSLTFNIRADLSTVPQDEKYLNDIASYTLPNNSDYAIVSVSKLSKDGYSHELKIKKEKGNVKDNTLVHVVLKKPQFPKWVEGMNDPKGSDYLNGHVSSKPRTFGIKWYLEGVYEAFEGDIASFDVLIK